MPACRLPQGLHHGVTMPWTVLQGSQDQGIQMTLQLLALHE